MKDKSLESMESFFDKRAESYENHMFNNVEGTDLFYKETAKLIPAKDNIHILDLGCGTGLEIDEIFKINKNVFITGIDLSSKMLDVLKEKNKENFERIKLINASYFDVDFGINEFDVAVSVQTMHHFSKEQKIILYSKIRAALKPGGFYIETDYTASNEDEENKFVENLKLIRNEKEYIEGTHHFDIPFTVNTQKKLFMRAGFKKVLHLSQFANTSILVSYK